MKNHQINTTFSGDISRLFNHPRVRLGERLPQKSAPAGKPDARTICSQRIAMIIAKEMLKCR